ncbi:MAG: T9SS type A sorting domain-containing protein, partial [Ekhidna sp.]|nr:T9SS type A sorting domain-containing protein [Ekhidna sp.]
LTFEDLEPLTAQESITDLDYADQASVRYNQATVDNEPIKIPHLSSYVLTIGTGGMGIGGSANTYRWYQNDTQIATDDDYVVAGSEGVISEIDFESMGTFRTEVTNNLVPNLTIEVEPQTVFATADVQVRLLNNQDNLIEGENFDGALLETVRRTSGYDTLERASNVMSSFTFQDVVLGDYLCGIDPRSDETFIPTYLGDDIQWENADTAKIRADIALDIRMVGEPEELNEDNGGDGELEVIVEEDFGDENTRIDARRRAAKRKCGLRRKRSGGRVDQDDDEFELIAYGETDDNGEFKFGFLPAGTYRFFVEYPGIPLDESSEVEFEVGEAGISDTDFKLEAFASEDGISVSIDPILGVILEYFKDLKVYPNPSTDYINIRYRHLKSQDVRVDLIDLAGNTMWRQDLRNGFDGELRIDVTDYKEGIYLLRFYDTTGNSDNVVTYRMMVRK